MILPNMVHLLNFHFRNWKKHLALAKKIKEPIEQSFNNIYAFQRLKISYTIMSIHRLKYKAELTKLFKKIKCILRSDIDAILLCGKQGISLRGHRDDSADPSTNRGIFLAILEAFADRDSILKEHNARYTSKTIKMI